MALSYYLFQDTKHINNKIKAGIALIIGGGTGNLIDRIFRGYVIDFIDINKWINYPLFNIADLSIVVGVILIIFYLLKITIKEQEKA